MTLWFNKLKIARGKTRSSLKALAGKICDIKRGVKSVQQIKFIEHFFVYFVFLYLPLSSSGNKIKSVRFSHSLHTKMDFQFIDRFYFASWPYRKVFRENISAKDYVKNDILCVIQFLLYRNFRCILQNDIDLRATVSKMLSKRKMRIKNTNENIIVVEHFP